MEAMPDLVLGPIHRYAGETEATVWVEASAPCEVEVLGARARTFSVEGHHYALVLITGLEPGRTYPYEVRLDGERRWPEPGSRFPPSVIRTLAPGADLDVAFGSCRVALPHEPPYTLSPDRDERGREWDALYALALRMRREPTERWPDRLLMLGDQVYVDEGSPGVRDRIRATRDSSVPPGLGVADFEEYTWVYRESWGDPVIRWLLSTVPTAMVWDDHDMHDDWNISASWVREMRREGWWQQRVEGGIASYWLYQHLGNLTPAELRRNELFHRVREAGDAGMLLRDFARRADHEAEGTRWSYRRDWGRVRLVVVDSRAGRVLDDTRHSHHEHKRAMIDDHEWEWLEEQCTGDLDHLLIASSMPILMVPGLHDLEAWSEAVCDGAWGARAARWGERVRRALDLEHWAAFQDSFHRIARLLEDVAAGRRGRPPATICLLGGDVHHAFLAEVAFRPGAQVRSRVVQAVCSPFRNDLPRSQQRILRISASRVGRAAGAALAAAAGVEDPGIRWRITDGPYFDNQVATLRIRGSSLEVDIDKTIAGDPHPELQRVCRRRLA
jgi:phosphodiesterase/alkaline phosphatase D-like protein